MLTCLTTILIGFTYPLSDIDKSVLKTASQNCSKYYPEAPCLVKLVKKKEQVYNALCGPKVKK